MSLILYINGGQADLSPGQVIAQTLQVNDLNSLQNRQASYTNKFSLPKTANNIKLLDYLTLPGNTSNVPYQKNTCSLYSHTGECFVYNGWAQITDGGDSYECVVYDGIIDLYKAIENKTLADLDLSALTHDKNHLTVAATFVSEDTPYRYIIADYNGDMNYKTVGSGYFIINIDYLVPSVSVAWLWAQIFHAFNGGQQPTGSIFSTPEFNNLWMTFPKGAIQGEEQEVEAFSREEIALQGTQYHDWDRFLIPIGPVTEINNEYANTNGLSVKHVRVKQPGTYRLEFSGTLRANNPVAVKIGLNSSGIAEANITNTITLDPFFDTDDEQTEFEFTRILQLNANDTLCLLFDKTGSSKFDFYSGDGDNLMNVRLVYMGDYTIDFSEAFADFGIRDFLNEVVWRFGLTIIKDKYSNNYRFVTLHELLETAPSVNWSRKFAGKVSEDYLTGSYAQRNALCHTYNDKEAAFNDGYIDVPNQNLADTKTLIKSKLYSPEQQTTAYANRRLNIYKMWEKEIDQREEDGDVEGETVTITTIKYKPLDKRFYFMYAVADPHTYVVKSAITGLGITVEGAWYESFGGLSFKDVVQTHYAPITNMLSRALVVTAQMYLSENDIANFDFNKFYYIEQLGASFLVNKISNYVPGKPVSVELIRIRQGFYNQLPLYITAIEAEQDSGGSQQITVHFISQLEPGTNITLQYQTEDIWENPLSGTTSPLVFNVPAPLVGQTKQMRLGYQGGISNAVTAIWLGTYTIVV